LGLYVTFEQVRLRLVGKVRFTEDDNEENKMHVALAARLINEAEGQVEQDLSPRYAAPFVTDAGAAFAQLPERPTREILRTLCELMACMRILETDFGTGSATEGEKYTKALKKRYDEVTGRLLEKRKDGAIASQGFMYPPLPGLKLNYMNEKADDGFMGSVIVASGSPLPGYASEQVNDPSQSFWNRWP
jgi:hypothetical protein